MPRTKAVKKAPAVQESEQNEKYKNVLRVLQSKREELRSKIIEEKTKMLHLFRTFVQEEKCSSFPFKYLNMTIAQIINSKSSETMPISVSSISKSDLLNITKSIKKERRTLKRSTSFADDEGYLTTESVNSGGRKSRSKSRQTQSTRKTRSLSKTNNKQLRVPNDSYGLVTPKCKPNTPQIILRRPNRGELAMSLQGSPLYTSDIISNTMANVNIPLLDGRTLTLQPKRGLRTSQIPEVDPETLRQLRTLRENINKVCSANELTRK